MYTLDVKDKKILHHLDINSRQSFRSIGRKIGLSKDTVASRVKRLQEDGIIKRFIPVINQSLIGYKLFRLYVVFQYTTSEIREEIINYLVNTKIVTIVVKTEGNFDLAVFVAVKKISEFAVFYYDLLSKYRDNFSEIIFSLYIEYHEHPRLFFMEKSDYEQAISTKCY